MSTIFAAFSGTFRVIGETEEQGEIYDMARTTLERISEDLACLYVGDVENPGSANEKGSKPLLVGEDLQTDDQSADTLLFLSWAHVSFNFGRVPEGPAEIAYYTRALENTNTLALYRSDTLDYLESPDTGEGGLLLCDQLKWVDFTFYDQQGQSHKQWDTTQTELKNSSLPSRVTVSLGFNNILDPEKPLEFRTGVALPPR